MNTTPDDYSTDHAADSEQPEAPPLVVVRYGLAKEIRLFPDALVFIAREEDEEDRFPLATIQRLIMQPGEKIPSKLLLMLEFDDGVTIIAAEGMTNVTAFRELLARLPEVAPHIMLDPPDMSTQLQQAVANKRQTNMGCYGAVLAAILVIVLVCVLGNLITHH